MADETRSVEEMVQESLEVHKKNTAKRKVNRRILWTVASVIGAVTLAGGILAGTWAITRNSQEATTAQVVSKKACEEAQNVRDGFIDALKKQESEPTQGALQFDPNVAGDDARLRDFILYLNDVLGKRAAPANDGDRETTAEFFDRVVPKKEC